MSDASPSMFRRHDSPDSSVYDNHAPVQRVDHHDHGGKTIAIVALVVGGVLGGIAIGMIITALALAPMVIDSKIAAGAKQAEATAQAGKEHARIALDEVQRANAQLEAKGLIRGSH